jgi:hypothetical protein
MIGQMIGPFGADDVVSEHFEFIEPIRLRRPPSVYTAAELIQHRVAAIQKLIPRLSIGVRMKDLRRWLESYGKNPAECPL